MTRPHSWACGSLPSMSRIFKPRFYSAGSVNCVHDARPIITSTGGARSNCSLTAFCRDPTEPCSIRSKGVLHVYDYRSMIKDIAYDPHAGSRNLCGQKTTLYTICSVATMGHPREVLKCLAPRTMSTTHQALSPWSHYKHPQQHPQVGVPIQGSISTRHVAIAHKRENLGTNYLAKIIQAPSQIGSTGSTRFLGCCHDIRACGGQSSSLFLRARRRVAPSWSHT